MAKKNILKNDFFTSTSQYKAICREKDLKSDWRSTEKEAILDGLNHQGQNPSHHFEILVQQTQRFVAKISKDKIDDALK
jgi:hypothetical protein